MKKQNIPLTVSMLALSIFLASLAAKAESQIDLMCRSKAKEVALQTFNDCETSEKSAKLNDLKKRYKDRMAEVKNEFQAELDSINGKAAAEKGAKEADSAKAAVEKSSPAPIAPEAKAEVVKPAKKAKAAKVAAATRKHAEKPVQGVAKSLPVKQNDNGPAMPIQQTEEDDQPTVTLVPVATVEKSDMTVEGASESPQE